MEKCVVKFDTLNKKAFKVKSDLYLLNLNVAKAYFKGRKRKYFKEDTPVGVSITIYEKKTKMVKVTKVNQPSVGDIHYGNFVGTFLTALENVAFDKARQVGELYIERYYDPNPRIEYEVFEL